MQDVIADVRNFLGSQLRIANSDTIDADFPLVKRGVLDSIELMQIVEFVEKTYGVAIDDTEILPENLGSLTAIAQLVERKRQQPRR
jgi:acyl carrier protein